MAQDLPDWQCVAWLQFPACASDQHNKMRIFFEGNIREMDTERHTPSPKDNLRPISSNPLSPQFLTLVPSVPQASSLRSWGSRPVSTCHLVEADRPAWRRFGELPHEALCSPAAVDAWVLINKTEPSPFLPAVATTLRQAGGGRLVTYLYHNLGGVSNAS